VGVLLPLHWQAVVLLLAGVATSARVVIAAVPGDLAGCEAAFVLAEHADAAHDAGVDEVLVLSGHPLGLPVPGHTGLALDYAREVPSYADHYGGPRPQRAQVEVAGSPVTALAGLDPTTRLLTVLDLAAPGGAAVLLGALTAGAGLVLLRAGDPEGVAAAERVTATAGTRVEGLTVLA
jgi:hypothetical protein